MEESPLQGTGVERGHNHRVTNSKQFTIKTFWAFLRNVLEQHKSWHH